jgi:putative ABC transport system permease protein
MRFWRWLYSIRLRVRTLFRRSQVERELAEELRFHIEQRIDQEIANGFSPEQARAIAVRSLDGIERQKEECRDSWGTRLLDQFGQDIRYALKGITRERRFALSVAATIALATGAATAIFSVVDRSLFRPLPYTHGRQLVSVSLVIPLWGPDDYMFVGAYRDWSDTQDVVELTSWSGVRACDYGGDSPQRISCALVESTFLPTLGVQPILGRTFTAEEDQRGAEPVALLSHAMWRATMGSDPGAIGKQISLNGEPTRVIGVLPANFEMPDLSPADILVPQQLPARGRNRPAQIIGRLQPGLTAATTAAVLEPLFQRYRAEFGDVIGNNFTEGMLLRVEPLRDRQLQQHQLALWMLFGAVVAFVLIACANVTNLILARSAGRRQEFALRTALGGTQGRLTAQLFTEGGLLGLIGGAAGCGLAWALLQFLISLAPDGMLRMSQATLDLRVLGFALLLSVGTALVVGFAPTFDRVKTQELGGRRSTSTQRTRMRQLLITAQLAVSLVLLSCASLLLVSLDRIQNAQLGFSSEHVVAATVALPAHSYADDTSQLNYFDRLTRRLAKIPGATATAITDSLPPGEALRRSPYINFVGEGEDPGTEEGVMWRYVTPGYFEALGIPIQRGRGFTAEDIPAGVEHVIVSESLSRRIFGDREPVGSRVGSRIVVGVAGDVRNAGLDRPAGLEFYVVRKNSRDGIASSDLPEWWRHATAIVRSTLDERVVIDQVRTAFRDVDPSVPVQIGTMESHVDRFLARQRFQATLLSLFAAAGLGLAALGLYGLVAYLVAARTREIGVRVALGATPRDVAKFVVSDSARWATIGILVGIGACLLLLPALQGLLYEVEALDFRVLASAAIVLFLVSIVAAWLPAHQACSIEPTTALRHD